jgi:hypothetical protein
LKTKAHETKYRQEKNVRIRQQERQRNRQRDPSDKDQAGRRDRGNYSPTSAAISPLPRMIAACSSQRTRNRNSWCRKSLRGKTIIASNSHRTLLEVAGSRIETLDRAHTKQVVYVMTRFLLVLLLSVSLLYIKLNN